MGGPAAGELTRSVVCTTSPRGGCQPPPASPRCRADGSVIHHTNCAVIIIQEQPPGRTVKGGWASRGECGAFLYLRSTKGYIIMSSIIIIISFDETLLLIFKKIQCFFF